MEIRASRLSDSNVPISETPSAFSHSQGQTLPSRAAAGNVRFAPKTGHSDVTIWTAESRQELASTGVPTGIERQNVLVGFCRGYLRPFACVMPMNWA
jgi:hypothetical protein